TPLAAQGRMNDAAASEPPMATAQPARSVGALIVTRSGRGWVDWAVTPGSTGAAAAAVIGTVIGLGLTRTPAPGPAVAAGPPDGPCPFPTVCRSLAGWKGRSAPAPWRARLCV